MDNLDLLLVVFAVVFGQFALLLIEFLHGQLERKQRQDDRRDDFQRQTLLDLQEALYRFIQAISVLKDDFVRMQASTPVPLRLLDNPLLIGRNSAARIVLLAARVDDEKLRTLAQSYRDTFRAMFQAEPSMPDDEAFKALDTMWNLQGQANERIGELLRKL